MGGTRPDQKEQTPEKKVEKRIVVVETPKTEHAPQKTDLANVADKADVVDKQMRRGAELSDRISKALQQPPQNPPQGIHQRPPPTLHPQPLKNQSHPMQPPPMQKMPTPSVIQADLHQKPSSPHALPKQEEHGPKITSLPQDVQKAQPIVVPDRAKAEAKPIVKPMPGKSVATSMLIKPAAKKGPPQKGPIRKPATSVPVSHKPVSNVQGGGQPQASIEQAPVHDEKEPPPSPPEPTDPNTGLPVSLEKYLRGIMLGAIVPGIEEIYTWSDFTNTHKAIAEDFLFSLHAIMLTHEKEFLPGPPMVLASGQTVAYGKPMLVGNKDDPGQRQDYVIPVYVTTNNETRLIIAYKSQSQSIWRRFAGCDKTDGHYCKGIHHIGEHYQAFDTEIQKELDGILAYNHPVEISTINLTDLGLRPPHHSTLSKTVIIMVKDAEIELQDRLFREQVEFNPKEKGQQPKTVMDAWVSGSDDGVYGRHLNVIVRSEDKTIDYCIAVTEDGMFVKYVQMPGRGAVSTFGSPIKVPKITGTSDWLFTPIIEYTKQAEGMNQLQPHSRRRKTIVTGASNRVRIRGLHGDPESPLHQLYNGLAPLFALMRLNLPEKALTFAMLFARQRKYDIRCSEEMPEIDPRIIKAYADSRYALLENAYSLYKKEPSMQAAEAKMAQSGLSRREIFLVRRYFQNLDVVIDAMRPDRFREEAEQWGIARAIAGKLAE